MAHLESWVRSCLNAEPPERVTIVAMVGLKFGFSTAEGATDKAATSAPKMDLPSFAGYCATKTTCF